MPINQWAMFFLLIAYNHWPGGAAHAASTDAIPTTTCFQATFLTDWLCYQAYLKCWTPPRPSEFMTGQGPLMRLAIGGMLSIFGEWMTQQIAGGMAGNLGEIELASHVTMSNVRSSSNRVPFFHLI